MLTSQDCLNRYGDPKSEKNMVVFAIPEHLHFIPLPFKIYCNQDLTGPLRQALTNIKARGMQSEIKSWDGCFAIRIKRCGSSPSLHSWGVAVDINAKTNAFGREPTLSGGLVQCFKDAGFDWGGDWRKPDGMHFQLAKLP